MSSTKPALSRATSTDSSASSNIAIAVAARATPDMADPGAVNSTPPTSVSDDESTQSVHQSAGRPKRKRVISSHNLQDLANAQQSAATATSSRNVSGLTGRTLVDENEGEDDNIDVDEDTTPKRSAKRRASERFPEHLPPRPIRRASVKDRVKAAGKKVGIALGKRSREAFEAAKSTLGLEKQSPKRGKLERQLDMGKGGILDEIDLDADVPTALSRPAKKLKLEGKAIVKVNASFAVSTSAAHIPSARREKKNWQTQGLYVGQQSERKQTQKHSPTKPGQPQPADASRRRSVLGVAKEAQNITSHIEFGHDQSHGTYLPLPMYSRLEQERDFMLPWDVFAPTAGKDDKPKDWKPLNKNKYIGEARDVLEYDDSMLEWSQCVCRAPLTGEPPSCLEDCLNRAMQYECDHNNCRMPPERCSNRSFADLGKRIVTGCAFDVGVEVVRAGDRGFGVRSCRAFKAGEIIMEYTGEIVSEAECARRVREVYKDRQHYYFMNLERNLVIDGTRGSMARFINHSCEPNCEVRMVRVHGTPRMGVFAGPNGIITGEELTYDYNFDNFGEIKQKCYCGTPSCRGYLSKRLNAAELKKLAKEEEERRRKAAIEVEKVANEELRRKKQKTDRGSAWRGWVSVDDAEVKLKLKEEKRLREEADKASSRAQRAAARGSGAPRKRTLPPPVVKKTTSRRSKTTLSITQTCPAAPESEGSDIVVREERREVTAMEIDEEEIDNEKIDDTNSSDYSSHEFRTDTPAMAIANEVEMFMGPNDKRVEVDAEGKFVSNNAPPRIGARILDNGFETNDDNKKTGITVVTDLDEEKAKSAGHAIMWTTAEKTGLAKSDATIGQRRTTIEATASSTTKRTSGGHATIEVMESETVSMKSTTTVPVDGAARTDGQSAEPVQESSGAHGGKKRKSLIASVGSKFKQTTLKGFVGLH